MKELREASPGITVVMEADVLKLRRKFRDIGRFTLPMLAPPTRLDWKAWRRECGLPVAPAGTITYDPMRGAEWAK